MAALRSVYGPLADSRIFYSTCTFQLLRKPAPIGTHSQPSAVCKLALAAWGDLPRKQPVFYGLPESKQGKGPPPDAKPLLYTGINCRRVPKGAEVGQEHIWFNNCLGHQSSAVPVPAPQAHRAFQLSDERAEREAVKWAHAGLVTLSDVMARLVIIASRHGAAVARHRDLELRARAGARNLMSHRLLSRRRLRATSWDRRWRSRGVMRSRVIACAVSVNGNSV